jgi:hypothetical protein
MHLSADGREVSRVYIAGCGGMAWHDAGGLPATVCFFSFFDTL